MEPSLIRLRCEDLSADLGEEGLVVQEPAQCQLIRVDTIEDVVDLDADLPVLFLVHADLMEQVLVQLPMRAEVCQHGAPPALLRRRITQLLEADRRRIDPLTGLYTRRVFTEIANARLARARLDRSVSLIIIDIDHFRVLNDEHGHDVGDAVLAELAAVVTRNVLESDVAGRLGGEEIGVLLDGDVEHARTRADGILQDVRDEDFAGGLSLTACAGIVTLFQPSKISAALRSADEALYAAKAGGRDRGVHYHDLEVAAGDDSDLELQNFENLTRVISERVAHVIARRGRRLFRGLRDEADSDAVTGIHNRRYLDRRLDQDLALAMADGRPLTLALLDIDRFGLVNKKYGWPVGDRVLRAIATATARCVERCGWAARYGGEEIGIVLPDQTAEQALPILEGLRESLGEMDHSLREGGTFRVTVSIGAVQGPVQGGAERFWELVSEKTLQAKSEGRNRTVVAPP